jgi:regulator of protease activity HflC (stomatin/prohibitin superfamily)
MESPFFGRGFSTPYYKQRNTLYFAFAIIMGLLVLGCLISPVFTRRGLSAGLAAVPLLIFIIVTAIASATTVDARAVGIQTSFGRYSQTLDNGFHWTAPWSSVEEFSTLTQNLHLNGGNGSDEGPKTPVAFKGGASGNVDVTIRWRISDSGAEKLWRDYKTFENVQNNLVRADAQNSLRIEFSDFTPVDARDGNNLNTIMTNVQKSLQTKMTAYGVSVDSVQITNVELGAQAQQSIDRIVEANANVQRAQADQERAKIEAETAQIRQTTQTPETLQRYCLEVVNAWDAGKNGPLPATFNCGLAASNAAAVIVGK